MKKFLLNDKEIKILKSLQNTKILQIVWDINAFYFVLEKSIVKLEVADDKPESNEPFDYDEIFFISVNETAKNISFQTYGEENLWYKIIRENEQISDVEIVRGLFKFPEEILVKSDSIKTEEGLTLVDCGVLFHVKTGIIPAVMFDNIFGFHNSKKFDIHTREEVNSLLNDQYEIIDLSPTLQYKE